MRDAKGRFIKGYAGGPGRPPRQTERTYLKALMSELSLDKWREIVQRAIIDATGGDHRARQWLSDYAVGRAPHIVNLNAHDAATLRQVLEALPGDVNAGDLFEAMLADIAEIEGDNE